MFEREPRPAWAAAPTMMLASVHRRDGARLPMLRTAVEVSAPLLTPGQRHRGSNPDSGRRRLWLASLRDQL